MPERSVSVAAPVLRGAARCVGEVVLRVISPATPWMLPAVQDAPIRCVPAIGGNSLSAVPAPDERASVTSTVALRPVLVVVEVAR